MSSVSNPAVSGDSQPTTVLLVEPAAFYASHLKKLLEGLNCQVQVVATGKDARASVKHVQIDLICIARQLPDTTARELAGFLRAQPTTARIPLVMITSDESQKVFETAYKAGFTEVFFRGELPRITDYLSDFVTRQHNERRLVGRVLYLEDTKWMATVTIGILHNLGLYVDHFAAVAPALESFHKKAYDIVVTDIVLEGAESGVSLVRSIRRLSGPEASVPILAVTGLDDTARRIELFRAGVSDYISKPVITEELVARVSHLIINKQLLETVQTQQEQLMQMATVDALTGLYNRRQLSSLAEAALTKARVEETPLSIMVLDIDFFKKINDQHGHHAGDEVLTDLGGLLSDFTAEHGYTAARFGGEEFVLLCPQDPGEVVLAAESIRKLVEERRPGDKDVTVSVGVAHYGDQSEFYKLFEVADGALYTAKEQGRNQVAVAAVANETG